MAAGAQGQNRHAERIVRIHRGLTQAKKLIESDPKVARIIAEIPADHFPGKCVIASGNRGMGGKDIRRGDDLQGGVIVQPLGLHISADPFQR
jgi:hypothetical protein